jgi:hypothetical protein
MNWIELATFTEFGNIFLSSGEFFERRMYLSVSQGDFFAMKQALFGSQAVKMISQ